MRDRLKKWEQIILDEVTVLDVDAFFVISVDFDPDELEASNGGRFFYRIRGKQRGKQRVVKTHCRGTAQALTDALPAIKAAALAFQRKKVEYLSRPLSAVDLALEEIRRNKPHAFWQPVWVPVHAPKDNQTLCTLEHCLRQILKGFDPCKPIELVRDGIHYSAKKAPPPHLFIRGKPLEARDPEATLYYDPICRQDITRIDDYEEAYAIVEEVLAEFRRVGLVAALCHGAKALDYQAFLKTLPQGARI